jgi:hypothetical protein
MDHPFMQTVVAILGGMALGINYEGVRGTWQGARGIPPASCAETTSPVCSAVEGGRNDNRKLTTRDHRILTTPVG